MSEATFKKEVMSITKIENPTKRRGMFLALLNRELEARGSRPTFLVGGFAVEIYTAGAYASIDLDIKGPKEAIEKLLLEIGFIKFSGSTYGDEELDIYVQWLGEGPQPPFEDRERALDVELGSPDLRIRVISHEDLIIDRLNQAKHWNYPDGYLWAQALAEAARESGHDIDWAYLESRSEAEETLDLLMRLRENGIS